MSTTLGALDPSDPLYRQVVLRPNRVKIDNAGEKIPREPRDFLDKTILATRSSTLSVDEITRVKDLAFSLADRTVGHVYKLAQSEVLPIEKFSVMEDFNQPFKAVDCLPRNEDAPNPITTPEPNIHVGYNDWAWEYEKLILLIHPMMLQITRPGGRVIAPFLVIELKAECQGGNLWHAENQAAGSGPCCLNVLRWVFEHAPGIKTSVVDTIAFSVCATHRMLLFHVHHYSETDNTYYMSQFQTIDPQREDHIQKSNHIVQNIMDWGTGERLTKFREALRMPYPVSRTWETESESCGECDCPNKRRRME